MDTVSIVLLISKIIAMLSLVVILYGIFTALIAFIRNERGSHRHEGIRQVRADFGSYILLGLEFLIAADIIRTVVEPTYQELVILGGVVLLRTVLSIFLNREIKDLETPPRTD